MGIAAAVVRNTHTVTVLRLRISNQIKSNIFDNTKKQNKQTDENEKKNYKMYAKEQ